MMPKIFLGISILLIMGSAVLGLLTKGHITQLKTEKESSQISIANLQAEIKKSAEASKTVESTIEEANKKVEAATAEITKKQAEVDAATAKLNEAQAAVAAKEKEVEELKNKPVTPVQDPAQIAALASATEKLQTAETQLAEAKQVADGLNAKIKQQEAEMENLRKDKERREQKVVAQGLEGQVLAVNQAWNFVVISIGDKQGVLMNTEMVIQRGSDMVAKVRVSSVEPTTAIADILPGSLPKNVRVQPGDKVIYAGS